MILTKPLGTGVLWNADMRGLARGAWIEAAIASMLRSNAAAARVAREVGASACTDVSGFGSPAISGRCCARAARRRALALDAVPLLPGANACFARGLRSTFHAENEKARHALRIDPGVATRPELAALFDPQTSGGLLFGVAAAARGRGGRALRDAGDVAAACIGEVSCEPRRRRARRGGWRRSSRYRPRRCGPASRSACAS